MEQMTGTTETDTERQQDGVDVYEKPRSMSLGSAARSLHHSFGLRLR